MNGFAGAIGGPQAGGVIAPGNAGAGTFLSGAFATTSIEQIGAFFNQGSTTPGAGFAAGTGATQPMFSNMAVGAGVSGLAAGGVSLASGQPVGQAV